MGFGLSHLGGSGAWVVAVGQSESRLGMGLDEVDGVDEVDEVDLAVRPSRTLVKAVAVGRTWSNLVALGAPHLVLPGTLDLSAGWELA